MVSLPFADSLLEYGMSDSRGITNIDRNVGDIVHVRRGDDRTTSGELIEDFAGFLLSDETLGRDWAAPHRWAVALTDGTLVFVDDADLVDDPSKSKR